MTASQPDDNESYLALFDPEGNQVNASRADLLSIEGQSQEVTDQFGPEIRDGEK